VEVLIVRPIYMDHSATTPVDPEVFNAMIPYLIDRLANSSSVHSARRAVEKAREQVAELINASPREIILTSGRN